MIGIGYRTGMPATASPSAPTPVSGSTSSVMTSTMVACRRAVDRGVNALETSQRSRLCSAPSRLQQALDDLVPQPTGRNALHLKAEPFRRAEPWIAQQGADQVVAEHLGPVRPSAIAPSRSGLPNKLVRLLGALGVLIGDRRQFSIDDARRTGAMVSAVMVSLGARDV